MTMPAGTVRQAARLLAAALVLGLLGAARVLAQDAGTGEKAEIESQRRAAEERYRARERECRDRFVVTSCVDEAQRQRRATLEALRARQLKLDETRRRARAAERRAEIAEKQAEDAKRAQMGKARAPGPEAEPRQPREAREPREPRQPRAPRQAREAPLPGASDGKPRPRSADDPAERRTREERSRARFEVKQRKAAEHRASSIERSIKRMHEGESAAPLPVPGASAIRPTKPAAAR